MPASCHLAKYQYIQGARRFSALEQLLPAISPRMLVKVLRELEGYELVYRTVHSVVPPRVEYSLTKLGQSGAPLLEALRGGGRHYQAAALPEIPLAG